MPIVLFRVDERLIHGQVVVGWGGPLHADRIVVVDDALAASPWEQELYGMGVPAGVDASFLGVAEARAALPGWRAGAPRVLVLVRDVETARRVGEGDALSGDEVNLGGLHAAAGRARVLPYLHLSGEDLRGLDELEAGGAVVSARDLPASRRVPLAELRRGDG